MSNLLIRKYMVRQIILLLKLSWDSLMVSTTLLPTYTCVHIVPVLVFICFYMKVKLLDICCPIIFRSTSGLVVNGCDIV